MEIEQELHERIVNPEDMRIIEINPYVDNGGEIKLSNKDGELLALRKYEMNSPINKIVDLLRQLLAIDVYNVSE